MAIEDFSNRLLSWSQRQLGTTNKASIEDMVRHTEGWSWQTYTFTLRDSDTTRGVALRVQPRDGLLAPYDIEAQYRLHQSLEGTRIPVPALLALERDSSVLGMPFYAMERIDGHVPVQWKPHDITVFPDEATRRSIGDQFASILAAIHRVNPGDFSFLPGAGARSTAECTQIQLARWREMYEQSVIIQEPALLFALRWLSQNVPATENLGLCHGDYRIGNFIVRDGIIVSILDWELAHIGDTTADLAWAALPLFRGKSPLCSHLLSHDDLFAAYERHGGHPVDQSVFDYWTVFNLVKAAVPHLRAARAFEDGGTHDLRLAAMGHQIVHIYKHLIVALEKLT
jgi:aminoglycoside phosphotransferase (APT) family kinase protein